MNIPSVLSLWLLLNVAAVSHADKDTAVRVVRIACLPSSWCSVPDEPSFIALCFGDCPQALHAPPIASQTQYSSLLNISILLNASWGSFDYTCSAQVVDFSAPWLACIRVKSVETLRAEEANARQGHSNAWKRILPKGDPLLCPPVSTLR